MKPSRVWMIALLALAAGLAPSPALAYDLKAKAAEFAEALRGKLNETEDRLTQDSRAFVDELKRQWRDEEARLAKQVEEAEDWKKAKQAAAREKRDIARDYQQKARVQAAELELQINRFAQEREREAAALFADMQKEVEGFRKSKGYQDAKRDLSDAKRDVGELLRKWKTRLRDLRSRAVKLE